MMNIEVRHPGADSLACIMGATSEKQVVRRSPHVGNVSGDELELIMGLDAIGANVQLEMVDTIHGRDQYSSPRLIIVGDQKVPIAGNKQSNGRVVGMCRVNADGTKNIERSGIGLDIFEGDSLADTHMASLERILPDSVDVSLSSAFLSSIGREAMELVLCESQTIINRPLRVAQSCGKIVMANEHYDMNDVFGAGDNPLQGVLPPLEAMMAIEIIQAGMQVNGSDMQIVHIAGPDMIRYTKDTQVMDPVKQIATKVLVELGVSSTSNIEYIIPSMATLLADKDFPNVLPARTINSQYDILFDVSEMRNHDKNRTPAKI
jgi:hypothetical protein